MILQAARTAVLGLAHQCCHVRAVSSVVDLISGSPTSEHTLDLQQVARDFARQQLAPHGAHWDKEEIFPVDVLKQAAELGFAGLFVDEEYGGCGLSRSDGVVVFEALSYGDVPTTAYLTIHNMVAGVLNRFGSSALKERYLPSLTSMSSLASYCLTEPGSGSDAASLRTSAQPVEGGWEISGDKAFISGAGATDVYLVMARTPSSSSTTTSNSSRRGSSSGGGKADAISAFLVDKGLPGFSVGKPEDKLGWRCQPTCTVSLDKVRVPAENLLGSLGEGFKIAMTALDGGRLNIAACSLGGASYCLDYAWRYSHERQQFGQRVADFQASQFKLADMGTQLAASRALVMAAAAALDAKAPSATLQAAMAKRYATDTCYGIANDALQLLGGYGYLRDYPVERYCRDLRVHSILEGTNEIMRVVAYKQLEKLLD